MCVGGFFLFFLCDYAVSDTDVVSRIGSIRIVIVAATMARRPINLAMLNVPFLSLFVLFVFYFYYLFIFKGLKVCKTYSKDHFQESLAPESSNLSPRSTIFLSAIF